MISAAIKVGLSVLWTFAMSLIIFIALLVNRRVSWFHPHARLWATGVLRLCRIRTRLVGAEHVRPGQPYIYAANHASMFDIMAALDAIPDDVHIMFKKELSRVPIWGWMLAISPYIMIDRAHPREANAALERSAAAIRSGKSVLIYAEGTRTTTGALQPFKRGAFALAAKSGVPIIPVTINGTFGILRKGSLNIRSSEIEIVLSPEVATAGREGKEGEMAIMTEVRAAIEKCYRDQSQKAEVRDQKSEVSGMPRATPSDPERPRASEASRGGVEGESRGSRGA
ncbi:MAG: 1-acyl-sn-glycerol-3-phosphate acyltransferase [Bacteroidetes bacterium]|jgi:1-acyl-sn-glycerol-3-phosphate acyltransferase|nr:1-acyl-sn-glycerol-3-phosphate acyltransferase [Bacteroidota bacterium]